MLEQSDKWADIVAALESKPVKDVAEEFGTTPGAITLALVRTNTTREPVQGTGAPPPAKKRRTRKKPEEPKVSEMDGMHIRKGTKDAEIAKFADLLGKEPDNVIAEKAGVTARTVATFRRRNGIKGRRGRGPSKTKAKAASKTETKALPPEKSAGKKTKLRSRGKPSKLDPYIHLLGTVPDAEVAELAGVSANAAAAYRRRRGIASFRDSKSSAPEEAPAAPETSAKADKASKAKGSKRSKSAASAKASGKVFRVALADGGAAFVLAADLVDAATQVDGKKGVVGVSYAGELLG